MPFDPDTAIGGAHDRFPSTRMSLLEMAAARDSLSSEALENIIELYWKPIYKYIRIKWNKNNEEAKDLTQHFLATALQREFFARFDPRQASFRTYIRMAVDHLAANEHAAAQRYKRGGGLRFVPLDCNAPELETSAANRTESPEAAFEREWRRQLFALAIEDLRSYCEREQKQLHFRIFEQYDLAPGDRPSYAELSEHHAVAVTAINNHLAWARRMLRTLVLERLRAVTSGERELRAEIRCALARK